MTKMTKRRVEVDGQEIIYFDEYFYTGRLVCFENRKERKIDRQIANAWKSYGSMKIQMKVDLPISLKSKLIDICVLPILTSGAQTAGPLTELKKNLHGICQRAMKRSIQGVKRQDRIVLQNRHKLCRKQGCQMGWGESHQLYTG